MRRVPVAIRIALVVIGCALVRIDAVVHACTAFCAVERRVRFSSATTRTGTTRGRKLISRFGLRLTPGRREMKVVIVDSIRRDAALLLLGHVGRMTRGAPQHFRQRIADVLTIR